MAFICIDPGHGGSDPGAISHDNVKEKDITLAIAKDLKDHLLKYGHTVSLTRNDDRFISLHNRCNNANALKADLFLSIHCNSSLNNKAAGTETFYLRKGCKGEKLATYIQKSLIGLTKLKNRGVKSEAFCVLEDTNMPAALVEVAFLSNFEEKKLLLSKPFQNTVVLALEKAIIAYISNVA
jgi:N-acetylmuramoyl-L-alanine amidase